MRDLWIGEHQVRPPALVAGVIGVAAVAALGWSSLHDGPLPERIVADVNAAYRDVPAVASTIRMEDGLVSQRLTVLRDGTLVGFSEEIGPVGGPVSMHGVATNDGVWMRPASRSCWTRTSGPEIARQLGVGGPMIATSGVRYEGPTRTAGGWELTVVADATRRTYRVDRAGNRVRSITTRPGSSSGAAGTSVETLVEVADAPALATPGPAC